MHLISTEYVDLDGTSPIILKKIVSRAHTIFNEKMKLHKTKSEQPNVKLTIRSTTKKRSFWSVKYTSHPPRSAYFSEGVFREWLAA